MSEIKIQELFKIGAHFGHQKRFWNPKMHEYVYGVRNNIHILNLEKTVPLIEDALNFISSIAANNGTVLFVGTKRSAGKIIEQYAERCGMPYVSHRWLGGMLTNFKTIKQSINRLKELESQSANGSFEKITKKEALLRTREMEKLSRNLKGIKDMESMPDAIFIIDARHEHIAISEAKALAKKIPVVAVVDTNSSPINVDYVIPSNDDGRRVIEYYISHVTEAIMNANVDIVEEFVEVQAETEDSATDAEVSEENADAVQETAEAVEVAEASEPVEAEAAPEEVAPAEEVAESTEAAAPVEEATESTEETASAEEAPEASEAETTEAAEVTESTEQASDTEKKSS